MGLLTLPTNLRALYQQLRCDVAWLRGVPESDDGGPAGVCSTLGKFVPTPGLPARPLWRPVVTVTTRRYQVIVQRRVRDDRWE